MSDGVCCLFSDWLIWCCCVVSCSFSTFQSLFFTLKCCRTLSSSPLIMILGSASASRQDWRDMIFRVCPSLLLICCSCNFHVVLSNFTFKSVSLLQTTYLSRVCLHVTFASNTHFFALTSSLLHHKQLHLYLSVHIARSHANAKVNQTILLPSDTSKASRLLTVLMLMSKE